MLDHLVVAARTLKEGRAWLEGRLNVPLQPGGQHADFGTHNALLSLGPGAYLEVIAVNPDAPAPNRPRWFELDTPRMQQRLAQGPQLIHWVAAVAAPLADPEALHPEVMELSRGDFRWQLTVSESGALPQGGVVPSLIHWHTLSPAAALPDAGVRLQALRLGTPEPDGLRAFLNAQRFSGTVEIYEAPQPELKARLDTPNGIVEL